MPVQNQFTVPQFIDVEDKIFGPITARQFVILLIATLIVFIAYKFADLGLFILILSVVGGGALIIAFVKINGQSFHYVILNILQTLRRPGLRIWNKIYETEDLKRLLDEGKVIVPEKIKATKKVSYSRIRDLSLTVNTGGYYKAEDY